MSKTRIILFLLFFLALETLLIAFVDRPLSDYLRELEQATPQLIDFFRSYTDLGKSKWYLWPSGLALAATLTVLQTNFLTSAQRERVTRASRDLAFFFASIAASGLVTDAIKPIIGRARPVELARDQFYGFKPLTFEAAWNSMPSGHATTAAALAAALIIFFPRGRFFWILLGLALALSRIMVNAHYLADVVAGVVVGATTTLILGRIRDAKGMFPLQKGIFPIDRPPAGF